MFACFAACSDAGLSSQADGRNFEPSISLTGFEHTGSSTARIEFDTSVLKPAEFKFLDTGETLILEPQGNGYNLEYFVDGDDGDTVVDENHYVLSIPFENNETVDISIIRQSPEELMAVLSFDKPTGFSILGETDLNFSNGDTVVKRVFPANYGRKIDLIDVQEKDLGVPQLNLAARIVKSLYAQPMKFGPSHAGEFDSFDERLEALKVGEDAVQCADYRNLFLHAAHHHGLNVRLIGIYNYAPQYADLTAYSHALVEVETSLGWIAVDPWHNMTFTVDGKYVSMFELRDAFRNHRDSIEFVPLNPKLEQISLQSDGSFKNVNISQPSIESYAKQFGAIETTEVEFE